MHPSWLRRALSRFAHVATILLLVVPPVLAQDRTGAGIPVADPLVRARCGSCHTADARGALQLISWARATPEGWQAAIQRMVRDHDVPLTPPDARSIVKYLSTQHGLAPGEAKPVLHQAERRVVDEESSVSEVLFSTCGRCHLAAVALSWRMTADGWRQFTATHAARYRFKPAADAVAELIERAPFASREWTEWNARPRVPAVAGRWLIAARAPGHGPLYGEMVVEPSPSGADEFVTRVRLRTVTNGRELQRRGRVVVYGGTAWRGRSQGNGPAAGTPGDLASEAREAMWVSPDGARIEGRWFWGRYDEFGMEVTLLRPSPGPTVLLVEPASLKAGTTAARVRIIGDSLPEAVAPSGVAMGPGVTVRRIVAVVPSSSGMAGEILVDVDVAATAATGSRQVSLQVAGDAVVQAGEIAIYDRVDYLKVAPESSLASFGGRDDAPGFQQFDAIGYHRGVDGKALTADDVALGPVAVSWSIDVFYETDPGRSGRVGSIDASGLFTPAAVSPGTNFDVWVVATASTERAADGKPLVGKGYLVVTVPTYTFEGRTFVRELGRWIETEGR